ncbi:MAG TPA: hypothetical protein DCZ08_12405 [Anaerolineaceae bacterium]|nr:hypothetical protein [Anaerolineaceae bacterium]
MTNDYYWDNPIVFSFNHSLPVLFRNEEGFTIAGNDRKEIHSSGNEQASIFRHENILNEKNWVRS